MNKSKKTLSLVNSKSEQKLQTQFKRDCKYFKDMIEDSKSKKSELSSDRSYSIHSNGRTYSRQKKLKEQSSSIFTDFYEIHYSSHRPRPQPTPLQLQNDNYQLMKYLNIEYQKKYRFSFIAPKQDFDPSILKTLTILFNKETLPNDMIRVKGEILQQNVRFLKKVLKSRKIYVQIQRKLI